MAFNWIASFALGSILVSTSSFAVTAYDFSQKTHSKYAENKRVALTSALTTKRWLHWDTREKFSTSPGNIDLFTTGSVHKQNNTMRNSHLHGDAVFGSVIVPFSGINTAGQWRRAYRSISDKSSMECGDSEECKTRVATVTHAISQASGLKFFDKLSAVNATANKLIRYQSDSQTYNSRDHWAGPSSVLQLGLGDCEDYVILKMAMLRKLNVPTKSMSLVVLKDTKRNLYHAVLAVSTNRGNFILDNARSGVVLDRHLPHYLPIYSFSGSRSWLHGWKRGNKKMLASAQKISNLSNINPGESYASEHAPFEIMTSTHLSDLRPTQPVNQYKGSLAYRLDEFTAP